MRILIVEDDAALRSLLTQRLKTENYAVDAVDDGHYGWEYASTYDYDLLILDVLLPQLDGVTLCKKLRSQDHTLPILLLTAQDTRDAKRIGWDAGADDYVVKPFDEEDLVARIRALLRRSSANPLPTLTWGPLWLDTNTSEVSYDGEILSLTAKEYALLEMMLRDSQYVFSREDIIEGIWASEEFPTDATVRSHVRRLRQKLSSAGAPSDLIATSHGRGYYLKSTVSDSPSNHSFVSSHNSDRAAVKVHRPDHGDQDSTTLMAQPPVSLTTAKTISQPTDLQHRYTEMLKQTWNAHKDDCLQKVEQLQKAIAQLEDNALSRAEQAGAYRIAHTLSGTLGTFGFSDAMHLTRQIEQELHPDIYVESAQSELLRRYTKALKTEVRTAQIAPATDPSVGRSYIPRKPPAPKPIRLMLVDDDHIFLKTILGQMQGYGFDVSTLDDPQQFWVLLNSVMPEVLILDVQMPHCNGIELCETLRLAPEWQKLPVMFLSITDDTETQHRAFSVGADDYISKPITAQCLSDRIRQRLHRIQMVSR